MSTAVTVFNRAQKAAAVMLAVGSERASQVMKFLDEEEVEQLSMEIATLGNVPAGQLDNILDEFHTEAMAHTHLVSGGEKHARELLRRLKGDEGDEILDRLMASTHAAPFHFLRLHEPAEVLQHLRDEHPQTIALVLAHLPARLGAHLLAGLDTAMRVSVATRLATLERADPVVVERVEAALQARLGEVRRRSGRRDGVKELADLLNQTERSTERLIMSELEELDPALAERVRALMFVFEDLVSLQDRDLQEILRQVEPQRLAVAFKGISAELRGQLEKNLSERARTTIAEEMDLMGSVRVKDVEEAQSEIVRIVHELEKEGLVTVSRGGEEEFVA
ncbi:MAG: flagellar motor switch protein FliG [Nitriliruptoraceae bacterium]|nr:flagellar motor switch protein FliG [Nitriliruptoraceae bacterium]